MKVLMLTIGTCVLLAAAAADARAWGSGFGPLVQTQGQSMQKDTGRFQRGDQDKRGGQDKRGQGRLTQEERQGLHRDLDRANREIYRRR